MGLQEMVLGLQGQGWGSRGRFGDTGRWFWDAGRRV